MSLALKGIISSLKIEKFEKIKRKTEKNLNKIKKYLLNNGHSFTFNEESLYLIIATSLPPQETLTVESK